MAKDAMPPMDEDAMPPIRYIFHINVFLMNMRFSPWFAPNHYRRQMEGSGSKVCPDMDRSKPLFGMHMAALLRKRLLTYKRDKRMLTFTIIMPAFFVLCGILILQSVGTKSEPAVQLTPTVSSMECERCLSA